MPRRKEKEEYEDDERGVHSRMHARVQSAWGEHGHELPDPEEIKGLLKVVREEIPGMLRDIVDVLYSEKSAQNMGKAVGMYYKTLKQSGIPDEVALEMTKGYVINIQKMFEKRHWEDEDEWLRP